MTLYESHVEVDVRHQRGIVCSQNSIQRIDQGFHTLALVFSIYLILPMFAVYLDNSLLIDYSELENLETYKHNIMPMNIFREDLS